jgi:hypothetical protein
VASHNEPKDLPKTWPFTIGGFLILFSMIWFCAGFALKDVGEELPSHMGIFYGLIVVGVVIMLVGAVFNITNERKRRAKLGY